MQWCESNEPRYGVDHAMEKERQKKAVTKQFGVLKFYHLEATAEKGKDFHRENKVNEELKNHLN